MNDTNPLVDKHAHFDYSGNHNENDPNNPFGPDANGHWLSGLPLVDGAQYTLTAFSNGDYFTGVLGALSAGLDTASTVVGIVGDGDPFAIIENSIIAATGWALSWLLEHLKPFQELMDLLLGDKSTIDGVATTWDNISKQLAASAIRYAGQVQDTATDWHGDAAEAYRGGPGMDLAKALGTASALAHIWSLVVKTQGEIVFIVRNFVRDTLTKLLATVIVVLAGAIATFPEGVGVALEAAAAQIGSAFLKAVSVTIKATTAAQDIIGAISRFGPVLKEIVTILRRITGTETPAPAN